MRKSTILLLLFNLVLPFIPRVRAVSRLRLSALQVGLAPASRGLTNDESYLLRDTVQYILEDLLLRNSPNRKTQISSPQVTQELGAK